jgi:hypothetical protein
MKPQERIAELEQQIAKKDEQIAGLTKALQEAKTIASVGKGKSHAQAAAGLKMLQEAGVNGCTKEQFATLNPKYPSDVAYYIKNILKVNVNRVKTEKGSVYMLNEALVTYTEQQAKAKAEKEASEKAAKAEMSVTPPAPAASAPEQSSTVTPAGAASDTQQAAA